MTKPEGIFKIGFMGSAKEENVLWAAKHTADSKTICVPFAGSCRTIAAMAGEGKTIESWDTQIISRAIIDGVFGAKKAESNVDVPRYRKGYMFETRGFKKIDDRSAGFVDWVGEHGTLLDKVAMFSAASRSTYMGRMQEWSDSSNINTLWDKFEKTRAYLEGWVNLPGKFIHHEASFFEPLPEGPYDAMLVDPPKVVMSSDIYSKMFGTLNIALGGSHEIPKWHWKDAPGLMRLTFGIPAKKYLLFYVSDVRPTLAEMKRVMARNAGPLQDEEENIVLHRSRYDYGVLAIREQHDGG